jgi:2-haloacid dehalogenase
MTVKAVLFDWGNVLATWSPEHVYKGLIADPDRRRLFLAEVCSPAWHYQHDLGRPMDETIPELQAQFPEFHHEIAAWKTRFGDMLVGEITGSADLLRTLVSRGVPVWLLTNMPSEMAALQLDRFGHRALCDGAIVSGDEGIAKPDPAIYRLTLERMGLEAHEVFFTDDSPANIEAAQALGLRCHAFTTPPDLAEALRAAGLPV